MIVAENLRYGNMARIEEVDEAILEAVGKRLAHRDTVLQALRAAAEEDAELILAKLQSKV